jgi:predicted HicB family RNase H-like nuclease
MVKRVSADDKISTSFKVQKNLHTELKVAAAKEGREMGELVEDALKAYLKNRQSR